MSKTPWIVAIADGKQTIKCRRCNASYTPNLPISIDMYVALSRAFMKTHKSCQAVCRLGYDCGAMGMEQNQCRNETECEAIATNLRG